MTFKILTFNIHKGLNFSRTKLVLLGIRDLLREINPDIIFLQEVQGEHHKRQQRFKNWPALSQTEYLAAEGWPHFFYGVNKSHPHGHHGNAILSKQPLLNTRNINISSGRFSYRGLLHATTQLRAEPSPENPMNIHLLCTHFGLLKQERVMQFKLLNEFIASNSNVDEPLILAGDFNDWQRDSTKLLSQSLGLTEVFEQLQGKHVKSYPAKMPLLRMDRIYYRGLLPMQCAVLKTKALSDHAPLLAEFTQQFPLRAAGTADKR